MSIAVSSWALHRTLGVSYPDSPATGPQEAQTHSASPIDLLTLPRLLADRGYRQMQLCHFHVASRSDDYTLRFRDALGESGVELLSLLIDDGDVTHPEFGQRDADWIAGWVEVAGKLGAKRARVIAGKQLYSPAALDLSVERLGWLATLNEVRIDTENWFSLTSTPASVLGLLDRLEGKVGLCVDFGNWDGSTKYDALSQIITRAETIHAKCDFEEGLTIDAADYGRCLDMAKTAGFKGPYVLVNGGPDDEWEAVRVSAEFVRTRVATAVEEF